MKNDMVKWGRYQYLPGTGLGKNGERVTSSKEHINLSKEASEYIAKEGTNVTYGARPLRRTIQAHVEDKFSEALLDGIVKAGDTALFDVSEDGENLVVNCKK